MNTPIKYSHDGRVAFDPAYHTYLLDGNTYLTGVTTYIGQFKNKFDSDHWSGVIAAREGREQSEVLAAWDEKATRSKDLGHAVHKVFEDFCETGIVDHSGEYAKQYVAEKFINDYFLTGRLEPILAESVVYSKSIASMRDMVVRDKKGEYYIIDWKTNEVIKDKHYSKYLQYPFQFLPDHDMAHYSLQLAIYKELSNDYPIKGAYIVHIGNENYKFIKPIPINFPDDLTIFDLP